VRPEQATLVVVAGVGVTLEVHGVNATTLRASVVLEFVVDAQPDGVVAVSRETSASDLAFREQAVNLNRLLDRAQPVNLQRLHVKDVDSLELAEEFETLETGGLVLVGWDLSWLGTLLWFVDTRRADIMSVGDRSTYRMLSLSLLSLCGNSRCRHKHPLPSIPSPGSDLGPFPH